ncbi:alpha-L-fucosidase [Polaribacter batillariae]|uniref:alpha-L-fucosidase n=1 Tax=Polaribacter batillariae TaxID=2808900 RepID=A0ABX7SXY6_9FLAO|nr:alpha-L-fucosidase [Polaribacter batillariae]QTD38742.1 alpha-L-fucosidase [Polaribacter batillariae]
MRSVVKILVLFMATQSMVSQSNYKPTKENLEARKSFQDDKFGMFIHWGVYSILGDAEWVMTNQNIKINRYELLPSFFNPIEFDAKKIVKLAKDAGMKYITITTKHHDGFAMYHSKVSKYNIVDSTPFKRDIFRELEQECEKQGIKLFAYYSQLDWHHTDYYPRGSTGNGVDRPNAGNWENYLKYQDAQIKELAENYNIAGFWFDGFWDILKEKGRTPETRKEGKDRWKIEQTYKMIHDVNPKLLIGNNHHLAPFVGEDFQMFEKDLPGKNTTGFGGLSIGDLPLETCETINYSWGFNLQDGKHKSVENLIKYVVKAAGNNANFLLNVGPMPNGEIQKEHVTRLKAVGAWLKENGETIYGTRGGIIPATDNYVSTQKNKTLYVHVLNNKTETLKINNFKERIKKVTLFKDKSNLKFKLKKRQLTIYLPKIKKEAVDTILEITLR